MYFSAALAAIAAVAPLVHAHDGPGAGIPQIAGMNVRDLKARSMLSSIFTRSHNHPEAHEERATVEARQSTTTCGAGVGSCAAGYCCSTSGYCGTTADYCYSPGCQYAYGPGCPENITPAGTNTSTVDRTQLGSIAYGGNGIYSCVTPGTVALTFDDGPLANYTDHILDIFKSYSAKATFFITGNNINKGEIDITASHKTSIQRMHTDGHQIASHTWTHLDLSAISAVDRENQMIKNEMALRNILGFFPTYMRPPYSSCTAASGCEAQLATLGYHVTYFNVDTDDYEQDDPSKIQNSKNWFYGNITAAGATAASNDFLSIAHDIHAQTAYNLTDYMLSTITTLGYKAVTVGECLGDPAANWYRSSSGDGSISASTQSATSTASTGTSTRSSTSATASASTTSSVRTTTSSVRSSSTVSTTTSTSTSAAASATKKVTTDATCGGTNGYTCLGSAFGNCCSTNGWCGFTKAYCGTGCNKSYGICM